MRHAIRLAVVAAAALVATGCAYLAEPPERPMAPAPLPPAAPPAPSLAVVDTVQSPAWVRRAGRRQALAAGEPVHAGDTLLTGPGARVQLRMADASVVKLGEGAELGVPVLRETRGGALKAVLKVARGAFRYTTQALGRDRPRDIAVSIGGAITAGVRGTDLWGKAADGEDLVCLIEGRIEVAAGAAPAQPLEAARSVLRVPAGGEARPVETISAEQLATWAAETEPAPGVPLQTADGRYSLSLASTQSAEAAARVSARFGGRGYATVVQEADVDGARWHRVLLPGFATARQARQRVPALEAELGIQGAWVPRP